MKKYNETLILILVMCLLGGCLHLLQVRGVIEVDESTGAFTGPGPMNNSISQLEQICRITHDYLNGYLSGSDWGTVLPEEVMKEEIAQLQFKFQLVDEMVTYLAPQGAGVYPLIEKFRVGFAKAEEGLATGDIELLTEAHRIFHAIDYDVFDHQWGDEVSVRD